MVGNGGDRGLLGFGDLGIVFEWPKQSVSAFYFWEAPYPLAKGCGTVHSMNRMNG